MGEQSEQVVPDSKADERRCAVRCCVCLNGLTDEHISINFVPRAPRQHASLLVS
jgi:hypothetical protein